MTSSVVNLFPKSYRLFISFMNKFEGAVLIFSVLLMAFNNVSNVVGRVALNQSLFFSEELNSILIILITFAGTSYAARQAAHIRMTAISDLLPENWQKILMTVIAFATSVCIALLAYFSVEYIAWMAPKGKVLPALQIPVYLTYLWVPVSLWLTALEYFETGIKNLSNNKIYIASQVSGHGYVSNEEI